MNNILLVSEKFVKSNSEISDNLFGSYLLPAIRTSQDLYLREILGDALYNSIISKVGDGSITGETDYKYLLDEFIQPYLLERVIADLIPVVGSKIGNIGNVISKDEYVVNLSVSESEKLQQLHIIKADSYSRQMQKYLLANKELFPELDECQCDTMKANLDSAASTGLWLGGSRDCTFRPVVKP